MAVQTKSVEFSKELDDAMVFLIGIAKDVREGKAIAEIAAGNLQALVNAAAGIDQVPAELGDSRKVALQTIGYRTGELTDALLG